MRDVWGNYHSDSNWRSPTWGSHRSTTHYDDAPSRSRYDDSRPVYSIDPEVAAELKYLRRQRLKRYYASLSPAQRAALRAQHLRRARQRKRILWGVGSIYFAATFGMIYHQTITGLLAWLK